MSKINKNSSRGMLRRVLFILFLMPLVKCFAAEEPKQELIVGFVPSRDVHQIQLSADRIAHYLSEQTGYSVKALTATNYAAIVVGMSNKTIDVAFVGPLGYIIGHNKNGAYPITAAVRGGRKGYTGILIVRKDSAIHHLEDLKGKTIALGDPLSASSNLYPVSAMLTAGVDPRKDVRARTLSSASSIVMSVAHGQVDAGAVYLDARENPEVTARFPEIIHDTRVIYETDVIPADPQIVRKDLNSHQVESLKKALLGLSTDESGKKWLNELFGIEGLVEASDADYDGLRSVISRVNPTLLNP